MRLLDLTCWVSFELVLGIVFAQDIVLTPTSTLNLWDIDDLSVVRTEEDHVPIKLIHSVGVNMMDTWLTTKMPSAGSYC